MCIKVSSIITALLLILLTSNQAFVSHGALLPLRELSSEILHQHQLKHTGSHGPFTAMEIPGLYSVITGGSSCPRGVEIKDELTKISEGAYELPHSAILQDSIRCIGVGSTLIVTAAEYESLESTSFRSGIEDRQFDSTITSTLLSYDELFAVGLDRSIRRCGQSILPPFTMTVFTRPQGIVTISKTITLSPTINYMIIYGRNLISEPCVYMRSSSNHISTSSTPSPIPTPTLTPSPSSSPSTDDTTENGMESPQPSNAIDDSSLGVDDEKDLVPSPSESPEISTSAGACFPSSALVLMADRSEKRIDSIRIGERVQDGNGKATQIFAFSHSDSGFKDDKYIRISTDRLNCSLTLTAGHYLWVNGNMVASEMVRIGDNVVCRGDKDAKVTTIERVEEKGLFNIHTFSGDLVVNGVLASTFTRSVDPRTANALLTPLRAAFKVSGGVFGRWFMLDSGRDWFLKVVPRGNLLF